MCFSVKAGGMRIVQHKKEHEKTEQPEMTPEEEEEFGTRWLKLFSS